MTVPLLTDLGRALARRQEFGAPAECPFLQRKGTTRERQRSLTERQVDVA